MTDKMPGTEDQTPTRTVGYPGVFAEMMDAVKDLIRGRTGSGKNVVPAPDQVAALMVARSKSSAALHYVLVGLASGVEVTVFDPKLSHYGWMPQPIDTDAVRKTASETPSLRDPRLSMMGVRQEELTSGQRVAAYLGMSPALFDRLHAPATGELVDQALPELERIRDAITDRLYGCDPWILGRRDPREAGFRVCVHQARRRAQRESARRALFHLELGLTQLAEGRPAPARRSLAKAAEAIGI